MSSESAVQSSSASPGEAFPFGENWRRFLASVDGARIDQAVRSLEFLFADAPFAGRSFLDAGSGSGLFSLAASRRGARVTSFDVDPQSVACTLEMQRRFGSGQEEWQVLTGSLLDAGFLSGLGQFDLIYSWGVVHHTGDMRRALELLVQQVTLGGRICLAIYNDQGRISIVWSAIKQVYNTLPHWLRTPYVLLVGSSWAGWRLATRCVSQLAAAVARRLLKTQPQRAADRMFASQSRRGMHWWYDLVDWIGGWPFEVARPEEIVEFMRLRGFVLERLITCGGNLGCNEFVFRRLPTPTPD